MQTVDSTMMPYDRNHKSKMQDVPCDPRVSIENATDVISIGEYARYSCRPAEDTDATRASKLKSLVMFCFLREFDTIREDFSINACKAFYFKRAYSISYLQGKLSSNAKTAHPGLSPQLAHRKGNHIGLDWQERASRF
jgi:hypothetical protein